MNNVAVTAHNINNNLVAFAVSPPAPTLGGSLATAQHAWPEHAAIIRAAYDRGGYRRDGTTDWFFIDEVAADAAEL